MSPRVAASYVTPSSPLWVAGRALLARRGVNLFDCWGRAGRTLELDTIHDLRVASRRVRECLVLFGPCYRSEEITRLGRKLKRLTKRLSAIRNTDEALLFLLGISGELTLPCRETQAGLLGHLRQEREFEARRLGRFLRKTNRLSFAAFFREFCRTPDLIGDGGVDPFMPVRRYVREAMRQTLVEVASLVAAARCETDSQAQHCWRIAIKKLRYRLEIVTSVVKSPPDHVLAILKVYQELLGNLHDLDVYRELVENVVTDSASAAELVRIISGKRSGVWTELLILEEMQPWEQLAAQIEEIL